MSKLIDAAIAKFTGKEAPQLANQLIVSVDTKTPDYRFDNLLEYHIQATYVQGGHCQRAELPHMMENFVKGFKRDAYDTIVNDLLELERAIYEQDLHKAKSVLRDIFTEVR